MEVNKLLSKKDNFLDVNHMYSKLKRSKKWNKFEIEIEITKDRFKLNSIKLTKV